jgi:hypothetical protein
VIVDLVLNHTSSSTPGSGRPRRPAPRCATATSGVPATRASRSPGAARPGTAAWAASTTACSMPACPTSTTAARNCARR